MRLHTGSVGQTTIKMVKARQPDIADIILAAVEARDEVPSVQAINQSVDILAEVGFVAHRLGSSWPGDCCPAKCRGCRPGPAQGGMAGMPSCSLGGVQFSCGVEANFVQCRRCPTQVPRRATGVRTICQFPDESLRIVPSRKFIRVLVLAPIASPTPSFSPCLPMWPSSRRPWPSSVGLRCCWDAGTQGVPSGEHGCENLPRGRWCRAANQRFRAGYGPWCCAPVRSLGG